MSGSGDGLNFDFLNDPSSPVDEPSAAAAASSPALEEEDLVLEIQIDESGGSIFDEDLPEQIDSPEQIPDPIPNVSDGTEVLVRGRTEIQEFSEEFAPEERREPEFAIQIGDNSLEQAPDLLSFQPVSEAPVSEVPVSGDMGESGLVDGVPGEGTEPPTVIDGLSLDALASPLSMPEVASRGLTLSGLMNISPLAQPVSHEEMGAEVDSQSPMAPSHDEGVSFDDFEGAAVSAAAGAVVASSVAKSVPASGNSRTALIALGGYAIVVTALCFYLLAQVSKARSGNTLESLPDVRQVLNIPVNAELAKGHTLALGEAQRFGNLRIEPLRVTSGPLQVVHFSEQDKTTIMKSRVLKLWVRLTNESQEQAFIPLDRDLVYKRIYQNDVCYATNFVVTAKSKPLGGPVVFVYDHPESSTWDIFGQALGKQLQPGESWETYIPSTEEGIEDLQGDLLWRIHFRKGLSPNGGGVTTLVEVAFKDDEIKHEG